MRLKASLMRHLSKTLGSGLLVIVPIGLTYLVLKFLFDIMDGLLEPVVGAAFGRHIPGAGLAFLALLVYLAGLLTLHFLGRRLLKLGMVLLLKVPVVGTVYSTAKQLIDSFGGTGDTGFKRVVVVEYPRVSCWTIGFLTGTTKDRNGETFALVYIPTAPTPNSGWVAVLPYDDVRDTDLTVQTALRLVLSGGITVPDRISWGKGALQ